MTYQEQQEAIKNKVVGTANDIAGRASDVADRAKSQGYAAKRDFTNAASDLANRASDALSDAGVDTETLGRAIGSSLETIGASVRNLVRDRPLGALAVTAAIGLVLGAMTNR